MAKIQKNLNRVALSGGEIKDFTDWSDGMVEDYISIHDEIGFLGQAIDQIANENIVPTGNAFPGKKGQIAIDTTYFYGCYDTDLWGRILLDKVF